MKDNEEHATDDDATMKVADMAKTTMMMTMIVVNYSTYGADGEKIRRSMR